MAMSEEASFATLSSRVAVMILEGTRRGSGSSMLHCAAAAEGGWACTKERAKKLLDSEPRR